MNRRTLLGVAAGAKLNFAAAPIPVIDAHTHFYDSRRPEGLSWPPKDSPIFRPVFPEEFVKLTKPFHVKGTVVIETGPRMEDNDWVLNLAVKNPVIVAYVGRLPVGEADFSKLLEKYQKNPLFRGIRVGFGVIANIESKPQILADLKLLAEAGMEVDLGGAPAQLGATLLELAKLTERIPELRMVINHLPMPHPKGEAEVALLKSGLREIKQCPKVYTKISEVIRRVDGKVPMDLGYWRRAIDEVYEVFGPDRVMYGSNWTASLLTAEYAPIFRIVEEYFAGKGREISEKYFWENALAAYRWGKRTTA